MFSKGGCGHSIVKQTVKQTEGIPHHIVGYHLDEYGDWVAELDCGHGQHVRHQPPFILRPWVTTPEGRAAHIGTVLWCVRCVAD